MFILLFEEVTEREREREREGGREREREEGYIPNCEINGMSELE